ncbi:MAG: hypothetical protein Q7R39_12215 [Dehalococcoidia bacterium]|nr:hypothetical protein [Dehalococcoidia bacterium]
MMTGRDLRRKTRVALGIEPGRNSSEIGLAMAFLGLVGVFSWVISGIAFNLARASLLAIFLS